MADAKISALTALTGANIATDDEIAIVDTSATATKKTTMADLSSRTETMTNKTLTSPTLTTPVLGTPSSGNGTSMTAVGQYMIFPQAPQNNPADATTYFWGADQTISTTAGVHRMYIGKAGTIKRIDAYVVVGSTAGSNETSTISLRLNDTTDTTITSSLVTNVSGLFTATVSIAVAAGDFIELKWAAPTYATNPVAMKILTAIYVE